MAPSLIPVPEPIARTAAAALAERADHGGGTRSAVMVASALATGYVAPRELAELRRYHLSHTLDDGILTRLHGGDHARFWMGSPATQLARTAAAMNPAGEGAMVALPVPEDVAVMLERPDGEPADEMHVTLFHFGGNATDLDPALREAVMVVLKEAAQEFGPPTISLTHVERFSENDDGVEPVVAVSDSPDVYDLRARIAQRLATEDIAFSDDHAFRCHVTIGYYLPGEGPEAGPIPEPLTWTPGDVQLHWGPDVEAFPLLAGPIAHTAAPRSPLRARLAKMSAAVNRTDRNTLLRLHSAATVAYQEAMRQVGVKLNTRAKSRTNAQRSVVAAAQGRITGPVLAALGLEESDLLDRRFDTLGTYAAGILATGERRKLRAAAQALGIAPDDVEAEYGVEIDRRATAASLALVAAMGVLARNALAGNPLTPESAVGEYAGPVPFGVVRQAFTVATRGVAAPVVDHAGPGPTDITDLASALSDAGGTLVQDLLDQADVRVQLRTTWTVGDPDRPFEPHQALDGLSWVDTQPDELNADPGEFPYVDVYQPGDHDGCQCELTEDYEPYEGDTGTSAPALVAAGGDTPE